MKYSPEQTVTVGILIEVLDDRFGKVESEIESLDSKMMAGFETLNSKIDFVDKSSRERDAEIIKKIDTVDRKLEQRNGLIQAQMLHLAESKADHEDKAFQALSRKPATTSGSLV